MRVSIHAPIPLHLNYTGHTWSLNTCQGTFHKLRNCLGTSGSSVCIFRIYLSSTMKNLLEIWVGIELNLEINLEEIDMFIMLNFTIYERSLSFYYCGLLWCFLIKSDRLLHKDLVKLLLDLFLFTYFCSFIINGIFWNDFLSSVVLGHRNAFCFCLWILYAIILAKFLVLIICL